MDAVAAEYQVVKSIGTSGQISLGKEHAGRKVLVEIPEPGVWIIRTATIIPDNERWLHEPNTKKKLAKAISWAEKNPAKESKPSELKIKKAYGSKRKEHTA
jgi:hypothetical protein